MNIITLEQLKARNFYGCSAGKFTEEQLLNFSNGDTKISLEDALELRISDEQKLAFVMHDTVLSRHTLFSLAVLFAKNTVSECDALFSENNEARKAIDCFEKWIDGKECSEQKEAAIADLLSACPDIQTSTDNNSQLAAARAVFRAGDSDPYTAALLTARCSHDSQGNTNRSARAQLNLLKKYIQQRSLDADENKPWLLENMRAADAGSLATCTVYLTNKSGQVLNYSNQTITTGPLEVFANSVSVGAVNQKLFTGGLASCSQTPGTRAKVTYTISEDQELVFDWNVPMPLMIGAQFPNPYFYSMLQGSEFNNYASSVQFVKMDMCSQYYGPPVTIDAYVTLYKINS